MTSLIQQLRSELVANSFESNRISGERFFKEDVKILGVKSAQVEKIAKTFMPILKHMNKGEILDACEVLWRSGIMEEAFVACHWTYSLKKDFQPADFEVFDRWIDQHVNNWATCDTFCNHSVGDFIQLYPTYLERLKEWALSGNRWKRRAAAVSMVIPARRGVFLDDIFEIADALLEDTDDLVQKGYGWMLKAASQSNQERVLEFVVSRKGIMPRTALRYAIEKMPDESRARAMRRD